MGGGSAARRRFVNQPSIAQTIPSGHMRRSAPIRRSARSTAPPVIVDERGRPLVLPRQGNNSAMTAPCGPAQFLAAYELTGQAHRQQVAGDRRAPPRAPRRVSDRCSPGRSLVLRCSQRIHLISRGPETVCGIDLVGTEPSV